jgi:hypothetical protein
MCLLPVCGSARVARERRRLGASLDSYAVPPTTYHYRDAPRRAAWLPRLFWADIILCIVYLVLSAAVPALPVLSKAVGIVYPVMLLAIAAAYIFFLSWIYRAAANAHALGADITFEAPGAVGWFIAPIVSFWMAFVVVEEIWRASIDAPSWREQHAPWPVIYWWAAWVVACLGGGLLWMMKGAILAKVIYFAGHIAHCYLLIPIVARIRALQETQAQIHGAA